MTFDVSGADELADELRRIAEAVGSLDLSDIAREGTSIAKRIAPKRTGRLVDSISPIIRDNYASVQVGAPYATFVLTPAWKRRIDQLVDAYRDVEQAIDRVIKQ